MQCVCSLVCKSGDFQFRDAPSVFARSLDEISMVERFDPDQSDWITVNGGRSPSPPPTYDRTGRRTNTRDMRLRDKLQKERLSLVEKLMSLQPGGAGGAFKFNMPSKKSKKIFVPVKEFPGA